LFREDVVSNIFSKLLHQHFLFSSRYDRAGLMVGRSGALVGSTGCRGVTAMAIVERWQGNHSHSTCSHGQGCGQLGTRGGRSWTAAVRGSGSHDGNCGQWGSHGFLKKWKFLLLATLRRYIGFALIFGNLFTYLQFCKKICPSQSFAKIYRCCYLKWL
jgi:hypothetical protein